MYRLLRLVFGGIFILLGFVGLFLPVLQGFLFLGIGIALLYRDLPFLRKFVRWIRLRYPSLDHAATKLKQAFSRRFASRASGTQPFGRKRSTQASSGISAQRSIEYSKKLPKNP